jgi:hypothetical protein
MEVSNVGMSPVMSQKTVCFAFVKPAHGSRKTALCCLENLSGRRVDQQSQKDARSKYSEKRQEACLACPKHPKQASLLLMSRKKGSRAHEQPSKGTKQLAEPI